MKLVKRYETFIGKEVPKEFDANFAIAKIKHFYSEYDVKNIFDDEIVSWVDEDEIPDKYENVWDWFYAKMFVDNSEREKLYAKQREVAIVVSEITVDRLIDWYEKEFNMELSEEQREELSKRIIKAYEGINPENW